jgi:hypothetical protein
MASIKIDQTMLEQALAAHLFGETLADPETRNELLKDLVMNILREKEYSHSQSSLLLDMVKRSVGVRVQEITKEWMEIPEVQEMIRQQVRSALEDGLVASIVTSTAKSLADRISSGRGY